MNALGIPANHPDFIGTVPIFGFQNVQKSGRFDFVEFQPVSNPGLFSEN